MDTKVNRAVLLKPDGSKEVIRHSIILEDMEEYQKELEVARVARVLSVCMEEVEEVEEQKDEP